MDSIVLRPKENLCFNFSLSIFETSSLTCYGGDDWRTPPSRSIHPNMGGTNLLNTITTCLQEIKKIILSCTKLQWQFLCHKLKFQENIGDLSFVLHKVVVANKWRGKISSKGKDKLSSLWHRGVNGPTILQCDMSPMSSCGSSHILTPRFG